MPPSNKKRKFEAVVPVEEIAFDLTARQEYLTGFHKRKLQRVKHAQDIAEKKARADKLLQRRKLREERKAELEKHVEAVNNLLRADVDSDELQDSGEESASSEELGSPAEVTPVDHEAEYVDEDKYTTVTVETMDISREGFLNAEQKRPPDENNTDGADESNDHEGTKKMPQAGGKRVWTKGKPKEWTPKPRQKRKKFRYESRSERKFTRQKEKSKNSRQAKSRREA